MRLSLVLIRLANIWVLLLHVHAMIGGQLLTCARPERLEFLSSPAILHTDSIPNLCRWLLLLEGHVDGKATIRTIETYRLLVCGALWIGIDEEVKEPLDVVVNDHILLLRHVSMSFDTELDAAQVVSAFEECAMRLLVYIHQATKHRNTDWVSNTCASSHVLSPAKEAMHERHHGPSDVCFPLFASLKVDLADKAVIKPCPLQIVIERVVAQFRHAISSSAVRFATKWEVIPQGAPDL